MVNERLRLGILLALVVVQLGSAQETVRVATINASLYRNAADVLAGELQSGHCKEASDLAKVLQSVRPDIVLINEIDYDANHTCAVALHDKYLAVPQGPQLRGIEYTHRFTASVNTGIPSGIDLDQDGQTGGPADAWGFGRYPGQYGMVVYSRFPFALQACRTFQEFLWSKLSEPSVPVHPDSSPTPFYDDVTFARLRLSSKSHWDLVVQINDQKLHLLASHPTPPVFDGPEDRNGCRNHDEIRFWTEYLNPSSGVQFLDDHGNVGSLPKQSFFVLMGDLNADPVDGSGRREAIQDLLAHQLVKDPIPKSAGAVESARRRQGKNQIHQAPASTDTAEFNARSVGNLRVDYVLPSRNLSVVDRGVFWPTEDETGASWIQFSDHRLVWVDIQWP